MHMDMLPECEKKFDGVEKSIDGLKEDLYGKEGYLTNHIPTQIDNVKKFMFRSIWGLTVTIISVVGGMVTALIILISKGS